MSENIRDIDGKKYWKNYNITPTFKNEKFDFESYMPGKENSNVAEDMYFFLNSEGSYKDDNKLNIPYNEARDKVMKFYNDRIDDEMAKSAAGIDYYQNKLNSLNEKNKGKYRVSTQPAFTPEERLYKSNIDKYYKNMRKFAKMHDDIKNNQNLSPDTIAYIYNKYIGQYEQPKEDIVEVKEEVKPAATEKKITSNPYKVEPPENYLKEPVKTPTMKKVEGMKEADKPKENKESSKGKNGETDKERAQRYARERKQRAIKDMNYFQYLDKIVDDFKAKNPKANISENENTKIWLLENRKYMTDPHKVLNVIKKHPELLKDEDLHKVYIDLLNKTKGTTGGERAERGYKV